MRNFATPRQLRSRAVRSKHSRLKPLPVELALQEHVLLVVPDAREGAKFAPRDEPRVVDLFLLQSERANIDLA